MATALTISGPGFNPFGRAWAAYERALRRHPVLTQAVSSAFLWGLGDAMAQRIESRGRSSLDKRRVLMTSAFGGAVIGPAGHVWYQLLDQLVLRLGLACSMKSMLLKVTVDNLLYSPCYVLGFFAYGCMAIDGLSYAAFVDKMREEFVPTMLTEAMVWPPYMAFVFGRVPVKHQLLAVNLATLFDVCFLSWMRTRDADAAAAAAGFEQQKQLHGGSTTTINSSQSRHVEKTKLNVDELGNGAGVEGRSLAAAMSPLRQGPWLWDAPRTAAEATRQELEACLWDTSPEPTLGRKALMAASATCSTGGAKFRKVGGASGTAGAAAVGGTAMAAAAAAGSISPK